MEKSASKITTKFVIKFIIWFVLFTVIGTLGVLFMFASSIETVDEDSIEALTGALNGLIIKLLIVDLIVSFCATKLALRGATKKIEVNSDNKMNVIKNVAIALGIFAILVGALHLGIRDAILDLASKDSDVDIEELQEDLDEYIDEHDLSEEDEEVVEAFLGFMKMTNLYVFDSLFLILMIPVAKKTIEKKVA